MKFKQEYFVPGDLVQFKQHAKNQFSDLMYLTGIIIYASSRRTAYKSRQIIQIFFNVQSSNNSTNNLKTMWSNYWIEKIK